MAPAVGAPCLADRKWMEAVKQERAAGQYAVKQPVRGRWSVGRQLASPDVCRRGLGPGRLSVCAHAPAASCYGVSHPRTGTNMPDS